MQKQEIQNAVKDALKSGDQTVAGTLRMLLASVITKEKEKRFKISKEKPDITEDQMEKEACLSDEQMMEVVSSEIKKRKDAIALYEQGNRPELAEKEKGEIAVLQRYLPAQLSLEDIGKIVQESIARLGAKEVKDMGKVMADLALKVKGKADGGDVSKMVKELLSK